MVIFSVTSLFGYLFDIFQTILCLCDSYHFRFLVLLCDFVKRWWAEMPAWRGAREREREAKNSLKAWTYGGSCWEHWCNIGGAVPTFISRGEGWVQWPWIREPVKPSWKKKKEKKRGWVKIDLTQLGHVRFLCDVAGCTFRAEELGCKFHPLQAGKMCLFF